MASGFSSFDKSTGGGLELRKTYLLNGNKESGKEEFAYRLTGASLSNKSAIVYIVTNKSYTDLLSDFTSRSINISPYLGTTFKIMDSFTRNISPTASDNNYTKMLNGPIDLTGLSVALSAVNNDFLKDGKTVINIFDSLSPLLLYNNPPALFRFMQFTCGRAKMSGVTTLFLFDNQMHSSDINETVKSMTDGVISLKLENGKRYFTVVGIANEVLGWTEL